MEFIALFAFVILTEGTKWEWLLGIGALASTIWSRIRMVGDWVWGLLFITNEVEWNTVVAILAYMDTMGKITRRQKARNLYRSERTFVRPLEKVQRVMYRSRTNSDLIFFYKRWPIFYHFSQGDGGNCTFSYIRGTVKWDNLLKEVVTWEEARREKMDESKGGRYGISKVFGSHGNDSEESARSKKRAAVAVASDQMADSWIPIHWKHEDLGESHQTSSLDLLSLRPELWEVVQEARFWRDSETWYKERGIPWRRGFGFWGMPGTGKTSLARAIAEDLDLPIVSIDLASMDNYDLNEAWDNAMYQNPCMVLLEDIDSVFEGRTNKSNKPDALTFDCLLNCIDGASRPDGLLLVMTTNRIDMLDDALKRPGRMDRAVEFLALDFEGRMKIALRILEDPELSRRLAMDGDSDSAAAFQERCFKVALAQRYQKAS